MFWPKSCMVRAIVLEAGDPGLTPSPWFEPAALGYPSTALQLPGPAANIAQPLLQSPLDAEPLHLVFPNR